MNLNQTSTMTAESAEYELWRSDHLGARGWAASNWSLRRKSDGKVFGFDTKKRAMGFANYHEPQDFEKKSTT